MPASASNTAAATSAAAPAGAVGDDVTDFSFWDAATGGNLLAVASNTENPDPLALNDTVRFAAGAMTITQNEGAGETNHMAERRVRGAVAGGVWVQYHTGAPGANGSDNVISEIPRTKIAEGDFTVART